MGEKERLARERGRLERSEMGRGERTAKHGVLSLASNLIIPISILHDEKTSNR